MEDQRNVVEEEGLSLVDLFNLVLDNLIPIIIFVAISLTVGIIYTLNFEVAKYTAKSSLIVQVQTESSSTSEYTDLLVSEKLVETFTVFMESNKVLDQVAAELNAKVDAGTLTYEGDFTSDELKTGISVSNVSSSLIVEVSWVSADPVLAAEIINSLAKYAVLTSQDEDYPYFNNKLAILDVATVPTVASKSTLLNLAISVILGGLLSVLYIFIKEVFSTKFKGPKEIEDYLKIPVMANVPLLEE